MSLPRRGSRDDRPAAVGPRPTRRRLPTAPAALLALAVAACAGSQGGDAGSPPARDTSADTVGVPAGLAGAVREAGGRVIVRFGPAEPGGGRPDSAQTRELAEALCCDVLVEIHRVYTLVPAVSATVDPDRLADLLADPRVDHVEADRPHAPHPDTGG